MIKSMEGPFFKPNIKYFAYLFIGLFFISCVGSGGNNPSIPGLNGPTVLFNQDRVRIAITFQGLPLNAGVRYPIPGMSDSTIEVSPDFESNGTLFVLDLFMGDLSNTGNEDMPLKGLPDGRPLPGVDGGQLPALFFSVQNFPGSVMYIGKNKFGLYLPMALSTPGILTMPYYVNGKENGTISLIGQQYFNGPSGILLLLNIDATAKKYFKRQIRKFR